MRKDIQNAADLKKFVNHFYGKVHVDEVLAPVFASRIASNRWEAHLQIMYAFGLIY